MDDTSGAHLITYKYRLYLTAGQNKLMDKWLRACSRLYNMPFHAGGDAAPVSREIPAGQAVSLKPEYRLEPISPRLSGYPDALGTIDPE